MKITKELMDKTEKLQKESHEFLDAFKDKRGTATYQDMQNVWFFQKLAELQMEIEKLKSVNFFHHTPLM